MGRAAVTEPPCPSMPSCGHERPAPVPYAPPSRCHPCVDGRVCPSCPPPACRGAPPALGSRVTGAGEPLLSVCASAVTAVGGSVFADTERPGAAASDRPMSQGHRVPLSRLKPFFSTKWPLPPCFLPSLWAGFQKTPPSAPSAGGVTSRLTGPSAQRVTRVRLHQRFSRIWPRWINHVHLVGSATRPSPEDGSASAPR